MKATSDGLLQLTRLILRLSRSLQGAMNDPLELELGLSIKDLFVLRAVATGESHPSLIASRLNMAAPTVSRSLDKLVTKGLIERELDGVDRRRFQLALTPRGEEVTQEARELVATVLTKHYSHLPAADIQHAVNALQAVAEQLEQLNA